MFLRLAFLSLWRHSYCRSNGVHVFVLTLQKVSLRWLRVLIVEDEVAAKIHRIEYFKTLLQFPKLGHHSEKRKRILQLSLIYQSLIIRPCHTAAILSRETKKALFYHAKPRSQNRGDEAWRGKTKLFWSPGTIWPPCDKGECHCPQL